MNARSPDITGNIPITNQEFGLFRKLIFDIAGINLSDAKKVLLVGRLSKRLKHHGHASFHDYYRHVTGPKEAGELQIMVDLLTTNETYFFREPQHFEFLATLLQNRPASGTPFRIWSAASSSGEEAYTLAMVLAENLGQAPWEVVGSDISTQVLDKARCGLYPMERASGIPQHLLKKYCLKGHGDHQGQLLIVPELRQRVSFEQNNLLSPKGNFGKFDVIFLRNVMIYFDNDTKRRVIANLLPFLKPDGHFIVGHSETLNGLTEELTPLRPTLYRRTRNA